MSEPRIADYASTDSAFLRRLADRETCPCTTQEWAYIEPELHRIADRLAQIDGSAPETRKQPSP